MDQGSSSLNTSSLIDLKAELLKKYESFRNVKTNRYNTNVSKGTHFKLKGEVHKEKKAKATVKEPKQIIDSEEDLALKKSREALEAKARIYENIVSNNILIDDEQKDCYLVDFQRKVLYNSSEPKKNIINEVEGKESNINPIYENKSKLYTISTSPSNSFKQEIENPTLEKSDDPIHYQNVQFNEIRDHGTGYFAFSMDESKRKEQMEDLRSVRQETEEQRLKTKKLQNKRKVMLQARLQKICERKNIDQSVLESFSNELEPEGAEKTQEENIDLSAIPLPEINTESEKPHIPPKVRPWDIGKNNLQNFVPAKKIRTQDQWIEERREERSNEFAPPSSYINRR